MVNALPYGGPYLRMCHAQDLGSSEAGLDLLAALAALPLHIAPTAQEFKLLAGEVSHNLQRGILVTSRSIPKHRSTAEPVVAAGSLFLRSGKIPVVPSNTHKLAFFISRSMFDSSAGLLSCMTSRFWACMP